MLCKENLRTLPCSVNTVIYLVIMFTTRVMIIKISKAVRFFSAHDSKKLVAILAK